MLPLRMPAVRLLRRMPMLRWLLVVVVLLRRMPRMLLLLWAVVLLRMLPCRKSLK